MFFTLLRKMDLKNVFYNNLSLNNFGKKIKTVLKIFFLHLKITGYRRPLTHLVQTKFYDPHLTSYVQWSVGVKA